MLLVKWERRHEYQTKALFFLLALNYNILFHVGLQKLQTCSGIEKVSKRVFSGMTPCLHCNQLVGTTSMCDGDTR